MIGDILVGVTREVIAAGRPGSVSADPIALAATAATGHQCYIVCGTLQWPGRGTGKLPKETLERIARYDETGEMEPFALRLHYLGKGRFRVTEFGRPAAADGAESDETESDDTRGIL